MCTKGDIMDIEIALEKILGKEKDKKDVWDDSIRMINDEERITASLLQCARQ